MQHRPIKFSEREIQDFKPVASFSVTAEFTNEAGKLVKAKLPKNFATKKEAEVLLKAALLAELNAQPADQPVMLKLTLPEVDDFYQELVKHPSVLRVVALSGGYSREESNQRLSRNHGVIASFSRALTEGLSAKQSEAEFNATLDSTIQGIFDASRT